jgi:uncharacterized OsmC-like protein
MGMQEIPETNIVHEKLVSQQGIASAVPAVMPRVVIVGAGFGGLQAARALRNVPVQVTVIDRNNHHLFQPLLYQVATAVLSPAEISAPIRSVLRKTKEVEVRTSSPVEAIDSEGVVIAGERIPAKTIIWTAGVAASPAGQWLGAEMDRGGRIKVDSDASVPRHPNIFVIGDTASFTQDGKPLPGVAQVAIQQGQYIASVIADRVAGKPHPEAFRYVDKGSMATIGGFYGIVSIGKFRTAGLLGWLLWLFLHLMYLIGFRNRLVVGFQWLVYLTMFQRGARLITFGDEIHYQRRSNMETENKDQELETASATLASGMHFVGKIDGFHMDLDAEETVGGVGAGPQPHRLLLQALVGCTAMDVISILRKKRQQVSGLSVEVQGSRADQHPRVYTRIEVLYRVRGQNVDPQAVARAIELSATRYCPVIAMLGKVAQVRTRYEIEKES